MKKIAEPKTPTVGLINFECSHCYLNNKRQNV